MTVIVIGSGGLSTEQADNEIVFPPERWAATFRSHAQFILHEPGECLSTVPSVDWLVHVGA